MSPNYKNDKKYQYIASGFRHDVFRYGNYAFKITKERFNEDNNYCHFKAEDEALRIMRENGFCVPIESEVISPGNSVFHKWTLRETWIDGFQYKDGEMSYELEKKIFYKLIELAQVIKGEHYGPLSTCASYKSYTWHSYLKSLHENHIFTKIACPEMSITVEHINKLISKIVPENPQPVFITMDTNLLNFFFDQNGNIIGMIDIEQPIYGDFSFLLADIRWCRDHWWHRNDWYANWIADSFNVDKALIDLYVFLIAFHEIDFRHRTKTTHHNLIKEFMKLEEKLLHM